METSLTSLLHISSPILLAPMAGVSGGSLAAAVSNAGGFGIIGGGYGDKQWIKEQLDIIVSSTAKPWGVGFITWSVTPDLLDLALSYNPSAVFLSFGDPTRYAKIIKSAGIPLICQVQTLQDATLALSCGADILVAQGTEAGGHGTSNLSTFPLVPLIVDHAQSTPVVAAGGIADGRGLAAALMLGASGVLLGTRLAVSAESLMPDKLKTLLLSASGENTIRTNVFDIVRRYSWPPNYTGRTLINSFTKRWQGKADELSSNLETETPAYWQSSAENDFSIAAPWCSQAVDLIHDIQPAGQLVRRICNEAVECFARMSDNISRHST